jgi:hypothetical protein
MEGNCIMFFSEIFKTIHQSMNQLFPSWMKKEIRTSEINQIIKKIVKENGIK